MISQNLNRLVRCSSGGDGNGPTSPSAASLRRSAPRFHSRVSGTLLSSALALTALFVTGGHPAQAAPPSMSFAQTYASANGTNGGYAIAIDGSGNSYVTGVVSNAATGADIVTVKYDSGGTPLWASTYNNAANGDDIPVGIVVDGDGNVYVAGTTHNFDSGSMTYSDDILTVKYDANGAQQWAQTEDGAAHSADTCAGIKLDASGNIYVAGTLDNTSTMGGGTLKDEAILKYSPSGTLSSSNTFDLYSNGSFPGFTGSEDISTGIDIVTVGSTQNIYLIGRSSKATGDTVTAETIVSVAKFDTSLAQVWYGTARTSAAPGGTLPYAPCIAVDKNSGDIYAAAGFDLHSIDFATFHWSPSLQKTGSSYLHRILYNGTANGLDVPTGIAVDNNGGVFVTGNSAGVSGSTSTRSDIVTIKYNSTLSSALWGARYNTSGQNGDDSATTMRLDDSGDVYIAGYSLTGSLTGIDYLLLRYSNSSATSVGVLVWDQRVAGAALSYADKAFGLALGPGTDPEVFTTGIAYVYNAATMTYTPAYLTIKYTQ